MDVGNTDGNVPLLVLHVSYKSSETFFMYQLSKSNWNGDFAVVKQYQNDDTEVTLKVSGTGHLQKQYLKSNYNLYSIFVKQLWTRRLLQFLSVV